MDVDVGSIVLSGAQRDMAPPQVSPRRADHVPARQQSTLQSTAASSHGSAESTLVSLLSQPSAKDEKQLRRGSFSDQELQPTKVIPLNKVCLKNARLV